MKNEGIRETLVAYYDNGVRKYKIDLLDGLLDGEYTEWYSNGRIRFRATYKGGLRHGQYKKWRYNGQMYLNEEYKNGSRTAEHTCDTESWYECMKVAADNWNLFN